jgi:hypothetical protein
MPLSWAKTNVAAFVGKIQSGGEPLQQLPVSTYLSQQRMRPYLAR